jgi:O-antigen/teichoic acid export membrane protein
MMDKRKNFLWNALGSIASSLVPVVLLATTTRIIGEYQGGVFSIAYANAQLMLMVGWYGMRVYQATDVSDSLSFSDYLTSRVFTCSAMVLFSIVYAFFSGYSGDKFWVVLFMCIFRLVDALSDVYEGMLQQKGYLDVAGKSLFYRTIFSTIIFIVALQLSKSMFITVLATIGVAIIGFVIFTLWPSEHFEKSSISFHPDRLRKLFFDCFPLFASAFLTTYIYNMPKYAIDIALTSEKQTYYNILFLPAFVINLLSGFVFRPMLNTMAGYVKCGNKKKFQTMIFRTSLLVIIITFVGLVVGYFVGIPILSWFYGVNLDGYMPQLLLVLIGGGFSAEVIVFYQAITVLRRQRSLLIGYIAGAIIISISSPILVNYRGIIGAVYSYLLVMIFLNIVFGTMLILFIRRAFKQT